MHQNNRRMDSSGTEDGLLLHFNSVSLVAVFAVCELDACYALLVAFCAEKEFCYVGLSL